MKNNDKLHWRIRLDVWLGNRLNIVTRGRFDHAIQTWFDNKYPVTHPIQKTNHKEVVMSDTDITEQIQLYSELAADLIAFLSMKGTRVTVLDAYDNYLNQQSGWVES